MTLQPVSLALKFGLLIVMYLFLLWVVRSAVRDMRSRAPQPSAADMTGMHPAVGAMSSRPHDPQFIVERAPGHEPGMIYDIEEGVVLGRGDHAEIRLQDPYASGQHARVYRQGDALVIEDLGSTNGTYLNEELLGGPRPLHDGDRVRIGDSEFTYQC